MALIVRARRPVADEYVVRVLRVRIKDKHARALEAMAQDVNLVWNYCNELAVKVFERERRFMSAFEIQKYLTGASKEGLRVGSKVFQEIAEVYVRCRKQAKRVKLRWRASRGSRRALGWIPFKDGAVLYRGGQLLFNGLHLSCWDSYGLGDYELRAGSISQDARGRWYANLTVRAKRQERRPPDLASAVGIDLGLKDLAVLSTGEKIENARFLEGLQGKIAAAHRARRKKRAAALHAKVKNSRRDYLHKLTTRLVREHGLLCIGDLDAKALSQGPHPEFVKDAGWSQLRTMLQEKCDHAAAWLIVVPERGTTRKCSSCGAVSGPSGLSGLAQRTWRCSSCQFEHDRDRNAALNILARGLAIFQEQFSAAGEAKADEAVVNESGAQAPDGVGCGPLAAGSPTTRLGGHQLVGDTNCGRVARPASNELLSSASLSA